MSRPLRIEYEGAFYHVINRGLERREIFRHPKDYDYFLDLLTHIHEKYGVVVYCYCLMPNHYHLYLQTPQGNLKAAMRQLDGNYTQKFNKRHKRVGPLFQGRYKAVLVEADSYSLELSKYIHLNPVKANMVEKPEDFKYSSYLAYLGKVDLKDYPFLNTSFILSQFHKSKKKAIKALKAFTNQKDKEDWKPEKETFKGIILGDSDFVEQIQGKHISTKSDLELSNLESTKKQITPEQVELVVKGITKLDSIRTKLVVYALQKHTQLGLKEIGLKAGNLHYSTVSHKVKELQVKSETNKQLKELIQQVNTAVQKLKIAKHKT